MLRFSFSLAILLASVTNHSCYGQRRPTKVLYDRVTNHADVTGARWERDGHDFYQKLYINETPDPDELIAGVKNSVRSYDITATPPNLPLLNDVSLPLKDPEFALPCDFHPKNVAAGLCHNYINVIEEFNSKWYYCGTSGIYPQCWICENQECSSDEITASHIAERLVTDRPKAIQPFFFPTGDATKLFAGANSEDLFVLQDLISDGTFDVLDDDSKVEARSGTFENKWIEDAEYVSDAFEYTNADGETHIYFFYRESAQEYINADNAVYSRVARVCLNDDGGPIGTQLRGHFTTFLKARLSCSLPGYVPYNYDYLQDVYQSANDPNIFYAAFTDNPVIKQANSAICVYRMDEIDAVFKHSKFKGPAESMSTWLAPDVFNPAIPVPDPRPGTCPTHTNSDDYFFLINFLLMNQLIPNKQDYPGTLGAFDRDSDPPVMVLDGMYVTEMIVLENICGNDIFFLGTAVGKVYKAYLQGSGTAVETRLVEEIDLAAPNNPDDEEVLTMIVHSDTLYVGTLNSLHALPVQHCSDYTTYEACILAQDPHCTWYGSACTASCDGEKCLDADPYSCAASNWNAPVCVDPVTLDPASCDRPAACASSTCAPLACDPRDCEPDYVLVTAVQSNLVVKINAWSRAEVNYVWGETGHSCSCAAGCPRLDKQETIEEPTPGSDADDQYSYLMGDYVFDLNACTDAETDNEVVITVIFKANGNTAEKKVYVLVDKSALVTDPADLTTVSEFDRHISTYYYQARWWEQNQDCVDFSASCTGYTVQDGCSWYEAGIVRAKVCGCDFACWLIDDPMCTDTVNICEPNPCYNEGVCQPSGSIFQCFCQEGFTGNTCEINVCEPNPCLNQGLCQPSGDTYQCSCPESFTGTNCEIYGCEPNPCLNQGLCQPSGDIYQCSCPERFTGANCENVNECEGNPCNNGGTCEDGGINQFSCKCPAGYTGDTCLTMLTCEYIDDTSILIKYNCHVQLFNLMHTASMESLYMHCSCYMYH